MKRNESKTHDRGRHNALMCVLSDVMWRAMTHVRLYCAPGTNQPQPCTRVNRVVF